MGFYERLQKRLSAASEPAAEDEGFKPWNGNNPGTVEITDADREQVNGSWKTDALDAGRGFAQGALGGGADELVGVAGGDRDLARGQDEESQGRSPWLYGSMRALGGLPRNLATGMLGGAAQGGIEGALSSNSDDPWTRLKAAGAGAATNAALHGVGEGVDATGRLAQATSRGLGAISDQARNAAVGGTAADYRNLAEERGLDYAMQGPSDAIRSLGLANRLIPQSPRTYANKAQTAREAAGADVGQALDEAGLDPSTHVLRDDLGAALGQREALARNGTTRGDALSNSYGRMGVLLDRDAPPVFTPRALNEQKTAYYDQGYKEGKVADLPASIGAESARGGGASAKDLLLGALGNTPVQKAQYEGAAQRFGDASMIEDMARNRAAGNQAAPTGAGLWGTLTQPATRVVKDFGPDLAANVTQLGADAAGGLGNFTRNLAAPAARGLGALAGSPLTQAAAGGNVTDAALGALQSNPQLLGQYKNQFAEAAGSPAPGAVSALITRLIQTDPEFRTRVLPQLRAAAGGDE